MTTRSATAAPLPNPGEQPNWRAYATCRNDPHPDRWVDLPPLRVHGKPNPDYDTRLAELSAVCRTCPARHDCLTEALASPVRGVFAATDEFIRADLRDTLGMPHPTPIPAPENDDEARLDTQRFTALRLARTGATNRAIAARLNVSPMTVTRLLQHDDVEHPNTRRRTLTPA